MLIREKERPVHLSPCKYRCTAKYIDDSHIRICVTYNCRYTFVLFNGKHICEFKRVMCFVLAIFWYYSICIISWLSGYKLQHSDGLETAGSREDLSKGRVLLFVHCFFFFFSRQSSLATIRPMAWPNYSNFMYLCLFLSMNPMRLNETVKKMERYVLPTVKDNDV